MAEIPGRLLVHRVTVETHQGTSGVGDLYAEPVTRRVFVDETRKLVRVAGGSEVTSEATLYGRRSDADAFTEQSRVTLPSGQIMTVLTTSDRSDGGLGAWQHIEVNL